MRTFIALVSGILIGAVCVVYWFSKHEDTMIMFPGKLLVNYGDGFRLEGSLVGEGENRPINNMVRIDCFKRGDCRMWSVDQLDKNVTSFIQDDPLRIESWEGDVVRLSSLNPTLKASLQPCNFFEIRVDVSTEEATYTRIPNKLSKNPNCDMFINETMQWRIDDGYAHQRYSD